MDFFRESKYYNLVLYMIALILFITFQILFLFIFVDLIFSINFFNPIKSVAIYIGLFLSIFIAVLPLTQTQILLTKNNHDKMKKIIQDIKVNNPTKDYKITMGSSLLTIARLKRMLSRDNINNRNAFTSVMILRALKIRNIIMLMIEVNLSVVALYSSDEIIFFVVRESAISKIGELKYSELVNSKNKLSGSSRNFKLKLFLEERDEVINLRVNRKRTLRFYKLFNQSENSGEKLYDILSRYINT